ncbi:uncharacterized protein [Miscanthus floridulus]|uniref:uncharacterized protein n=1 Tax=Miscanthus floridulus TaxID=154761 RepID=UPI003459ED30
MVEAKLRGGNLTPIAMRPSRGFLSLGMRDVRASPPPVPEDTRQRAINRAHAEAQKKRKDAVNKGRMRTEGTPGSVEDQPAPMDTEAMQLPPPPPLRTRVAVAKRLPPRSSRKRPTEVPTLVPLKALKVNPSSTAHWVAEAQAALQCGAVSVRADPKESATEGGAAEAALTQEGEAAPPPYDGEARGSDVAEVPLAAEVTGTEVPGVSWARATEAAAPRTLEAAVAGTEALTIAEAMMAEAGAPGATEVTTAEAGAPGTTEATTADAGAPMTTDADVIVAGLSA